VYAVKALEDMGFTNVAHLAGGFKSWLDAGESVESTKEASRWVRKE
jgi:rhodanese-related sulfurtransferase